MKKYIIIIIFSLFLGLSCANANVISFYFDASGDLHDSVYGFQFTYRLSNGNLLSDDDLTVHYTNVFTGSSIEPGDGAIPGTDFSSTGLDPNTNWDVGIQNNSVRGGTDNILGYTLGDDPLVSGVLFDVMVPDGVELIIEKIVLANFDGTPGFFNNKFRFNRQGNQCSVMPSGMPIPLPPSAILLVAGLIGLATIKRKAKND